MKRFYKEADKKQLLYKEAWFDEKNKIVIIHYGKVGYKGKIEEVPISTEDESGRFISDFCKGCESNGYYQIEKNNYHWVVIQFKLKSALGNKRDAWLKDKVQKYLKDYLGWRGLGDIDGFDMGQRKLNIFCKVVDEGKAVSSIKTCLRKYQLDLNQAIIATKTVGEENFTLKFSCKRVDNFEL